MGHSKTSHISRSYIQETESPSPNATNTSYYRSILVRSKSRLAATRLHVRRHILQLLANLPHSLRQLIPFLQQHIQLSRVRVESSLKPSERLDKTLSRHSRGLSIGYRDRGPRAKRVHRGTGDRGLHARRSERRGSRSDRSRWDRDLKRRVYN